MKKSLIISFLSLFIFFSCNKKDISAANTQSIVEEYLENNPPYETGWIQTENLKLSTKKDQSQVQIIKDLAKEGYINIEEENVKKRFLSKDSIWQFSLSLTEKSLPYVINQKPNKTEVKTIEYQLNKDKEIVFIKKNEKSIVCTAVLQKVKTPFYTFGKDKTSKSNFITRKFKLKYNAENGWQVVD
ncbi:hypothetical protein ACT4R9_06645 [Ornithobacterium rhinotracheale]|uniref:hypothetical protein n=1 Tax=Ornithobacterium rhinotracheale TaxID=28251 RepID=UPI003FA484B2